MNLLKQIFCIHRYHPKLRAILIYGTHFWEVPVCVKCQHIDIHGKPILVGNIKMGELDESIVSVSKDWWNWIKRRRRYERRKNSCRL